MKIQAFRMPLIGKLRDIFDHHKKRRSTEKIVELNMLPNSDYYFAALFVNLITAVLQDKIYPTIEENSILESLTILRTANPKNYHRFLFMLSFYWQQRKAIRKSAETMR
jgi:hypothetical protein